MGSRRLTREKNTVKDMIGIYCLKHHKTSAPLCPECDELLTYALKKIDKCRYSYRKPVCSKCTTHCYTKEMQERIRAVMRYSGPKMLTRHPVLAVFHFIDAARHVNIENV